MKVIVLNRENLIRYNLLTFSWIIVGLVIIFFGKVVLDDNQATGIWELALIGVIVLVYSFILGAKRHLASKKSNLKMIGGQLIIDKVVYRVGDIKYFEVVKELRRSEIKIEISIEGKLLKAIYSDHWWWISPKRIEKRFDEEIEGVSEILQDKFVVKKI